MKCLKFLTSLFTVVGFPSVLFLQCSQTNLIKQQISSIKTSCVSQIFDSKEKLDISGLVTGHYLCYRRNGEGQPCADIRKEAYSLLDRLSRFGATLAAGSCKRSVLEQHERVRGAVRELMTQKKIFQNEYFEKIENLESLNQALSNEISSKCCG